MEFDDVVCAVAADEELQPGQLYFALPLSRLGRSMQAQEMAALAVMASTALRRSAGRNGSGRKVVFPVEGAGEGQQKSICFSVGHNGGIGDDGRGDGGGKEGRIRKDRRKFMAELSAIPE